MAANDNNLGRGAMSGKFRPMRTDRVGPMVERTYRDGGKFQWVRETVINAMEADATRIEFGIEWQAVKSKGIYRRLIADNGKGMTPEQLERFFITFGGGGKPIGSEHENFGIGSKTSLLPWNHYGVVVVSWVDGHGAMIWIQRDESTGEYGLRVERVQDDDGNESFEAAVAPYDDPDHGLDWNNVKPDWIDKNGTVIILMGQGPNDDTVKGDPFRSEDGLKDISRYLNHRLWELDNVHIEVSEFSTVDKTKWPKAFAKSLGDGVMMRRIRGAKHYIAEPITSTDTKLEMGTVALEDESAEIDWYLWTGAQPQRWHYGPRKGFIGALYRNELYNVQDHHQTYRNFGISESKVRQSLWLVIRAPEYDKERKSGVYPKADRNDLVLSAGRPLPIQEWAEQFSDQIPEPIIEALRKARGTSEANMEDDEWCKKLAERLVPQFSLPRFKQNPKGIDRSSKDVSLETKNVDPESTSVGGGGKINPGPGPSPGQPAPGPRPGVKRKPTHSPAGDRIPAKQTKARGSVPRVSITRDQDDLEPGMLACYLSPNKDEPRGLVKIYGEHPVLVGIIEGFQNRYPPHHAEGVRKTVEDAYGMAAALKVAHSESLCGLVDRAIVNEMRSPRALTMALLGLWAEEQAILPMLAKFGPRKLRAVG